MRVQVDLHEQADEFARLVHVQAVFSAVRTMVSASWP